MTSTVRIFFKKKGGEGEDEAKKYERKSSIEDELKKISRPNPSHANHSSVTA